ncbi:PD-(D/E)XK motif protein [Demequina zhanjiangensis]|uniref:PD-(D/E)XK motif protein n=1 Tax=Demequina zhanjiangensis TaxID=3051659 RepID=A0ABT8G2L1_9MICO|nr:PD-(D/E)XK motif protein [Demequina sp. SYSU T00b26]MDN4473376.1 PD-(D/E)XK motif protein [Demequina sp. SYSU T00b26]
MVNEEALSGAFEDLRDSIIGLTSPEDASRRIVWAEGTKAIGVARDHMGRLEVFVVGEPLAASIASVRDALEHDTWSREDGTAIAANRLVLPAAPFFDSVAAFICAELIANGAVTGPQEAFSRSEHVIALAISRGRVSNQALVGLVGELSLLLALLRASPAAMADSVLDTWKGSKPSSRDFQLGNVGVEVKTTTGESSTHHVQGLHQVTAGASVGGEPESALFLLSVGISWLPDGAVSGRSIPSMVDQILSRLSGEESRQRFKRQLREYGGDSALGYDHDEDRGKTVYARGFMLTFERLYDMADPAVLIPQLHDFERFTHFDVQSMSFRLMLPDKVTGDRNPVGGMAAASRSLLEAATLQ